MKITVRNITQFKPIFIVQLLLMSNLVLRCSCNLASSELEKYIIESITDIELKQLLQRLNKGEKVNLNQKTAHGDLPLFLAIKESWGNKIIPFLLVKGADINIQDDSGNTPLIEAATAYSTANTEVLLEAGADINLQNKEGKTALMFAASEGSAAQVKFLLKNGSDVSIKDSQGNTALYLAVSENPYNTTSRLDKVKSLLSHAKADPLAKNKEGNTPLHMFVQTLRNFDNADKEAIRLIIKKIIVTQKIVNKQVLNRLMGSLNLSFHISNSENEKFLKETVDLLIPDS